MSGTKELGEAVKFVCALASAVVDAAADGKLSLADTTRVMPLLYKLPVAIDGFDEAIQEAKDLSREELLEVVAIAKDSLDFDDEDLEEICEDAIDVVLKLYTLVQKFS